jgi:hypothetical protein
LKEEKVDYRLNKGTQTKNDKRYTIKVKRKSRNKERNKKNLLIPDFVSMSQTDLAAPASTCVVANLVL